MVDKPRCNGQWTEARFRGFIVSALRAASKRWGPKNTAKALARVDRGKYRCAMCKTIGPATLPALPGRKRRRNNAAVDHIHPVVDPAVGFVSWDEYIQRMFCELEGFQVLCWECHNEKTADERTTSTTRKRKEREQEDETD